MRAGRRGGPDRPWNDSHPSLMTAPALETRRCPSCGAPVSPRAATCALCDAVLDASAPVAAPAPRRRARRDFRAGFGRLFLRFGVVVVVLFAIVMGVAGWFVSRMQGYLTRRAERALVAIAADSAVRGNWRALDSAAQLAARAAGQGTTLDTAAASMIAALNRRGKPSDAYWRGDRVLPAAIHPAVMAQVRSAALAALPKPLSRGLRDSLARDTLDARLDAWRRLARSAPLSALWPYSERAVALRDPSQLPTLNLAVVKELAYRNASAALLSVARGDQVTAARRLHENVAVAGQLMRVPTPLDYLAARIVMRDAATMLGDVGRATGDAALQAESASLIASLGTRLNLGNLLVAAPALFVEPGDQRGLAVIGDRALPPGIRSQALFGIPTGSCLRTREILFGVSDARRAALAAAGEQLRDLDGADALVAMHARWLDDLTNHPERIVASMRRDGRVARPSRIPFVGGMSARLYACMRMM